MPFGKVAADPWGGGPLSADYATCTTQRVTGVDDSRATSGESPSGTYISLSGGGKLFRHTGGPALEVLRRLAVGDTIQVCLVRKTYCPLQRYTDLAWIKRGGLWETLYRLYDSRLKAAAVAIDVGCGTKLDDTIYGY